MSPPDGRWLELSLIPVCDQSVSQTAKDVTHLARSSLAACDGAGIQFYDSYHGGPRVATDSRSEYLDNLQQRLDEGPCVECLRTGEQWDLGPDSHDGRWPAFGESARRGGLVGCLAIPLISQYQLLGVLNLYAWGTDPFEGFDRAACVAFGDQAAIELANARAYERAESDIVELTRQLADADDVIQQAYGVLMESEGQGLHDAMMKLAHRASRRGTTLEDAAQEVLDSVRRTDESA